MCNYLKRLAFAISCAVVMTISGCGGGGGGGSSSEIGPGKVAAVRLPADIVNLTNQYSASKLADIDKDGDLDLVLGVGRSLRLLLNNGKGVFTDAPTGTFPASPGDTGYTSTDIAVADFNKDGHMDIMVALLGGTVNNGQTLRFMRNNGNGTFRDQSNNINGVGGTDSLHQGWIRPLDYDSDGELDFITTRGIFNNVGFAVFHKISVLDGLHSTVGDFNGDSKPDLVVRELSGYLRILINTSTGPDNTSYNPVTYDFSHGNLNMIDGMVSTVALDLGNDGDLDLFIAQTEPFGAKAYPALVFENSNSGSAPYTFIKPATQPNVNFNQPANTVVAADFNGDGRQDVFVGDVGYDGGDFLGGQNRILIQNAAGALVDETNTRLPIYSDYTHSLTYGDIDGDGDIDIFIGSLAGSKYSRYPASFLINDGSGHFSQSY